MFLSLLLFQYFKFILKHIELLPSGPWDVRLVTQSRKKAPEIYLYDSTFLETLSLKVWGRDRIFVHRILWNAWSVEEKEAYLFWVYACHMKCVSAQRLFFGPDLKSLDRDAIMFSTDPLAWARALEKAQSTRLDNRLTDGVVPWSGLSFMGPSLLSEWWSVRERLSSATRYLKARS